MAQARFKFRIWDKQNKEYKKGVGPAAIRRVLLISNNRADIKTIEGEL